MHGRGNSKVILDAVGLIVAAALVGVAISVDPPTQNVLLGVATSFIFLAIFDIILAAQRSVLNRTATKFFGPELARGHVTFGYPDFEPHREVKRTLNAAGTRMRYQRPTSQIRALGDFWIDVPHSAASNDIEAILFMADIFGGLAARPDSLMTDRRLVESCDRSFISVGFTSSACTYLYLEHAGPDKLFELVPEPPGSKRRMHVRTSGGREFKSDDRNQYGLILRYAPDRRNHPGRRWFIIGGLGPQATIGAAWYLAEHWRQLARLTRPDQDFVAFVCVPVVAPRSAYLPGDGICTEPASAQPTAAPIPVP
jgi:hypothetical protein